MHQLKSIYNSPFKDSYSHPIHTCFPMIASNVFAFPSIAAGFSTFCTEHMSGDKRTVEVREARFGDYEAVVAIPGDFFRGRDYLPKMYHIFLQDKNSNCFVILLNDRIVSSFFWFITNFFRIMTLKMIRRVHCIGGLGRVGGHAPSLAHFMHFVGKMA